MTFYCTKKLGDRIARKHDRARPWKLARRRARGGVDMIAFGKGKSQKYKAAPATAVNKQEKRK